MKKEIKKKIYTVKIPIDEFIDRIKWVNLRTLFFEKTAHRDKEFDFNSDFEIKFYEGTTDDISPEIDHVCITSEQIELKPLNHPSNFKKKKINLRMGKT